MKSTFTQSLFFTLFRTSLVLLSGLLLWLASSSDIHIKPINRTIILLVTVSLSFMFYLALRWLQRSDDADAVRNKLSFPIFMLLLGGFLPCNTASAQCSGFAVIVGNFVDATAQRFDGATGTYLSQLAGSTGTRINSVLQYPSLTGNLYLGDYEGVNIINAFTGASVGSFSGGPFSGLTEQIVVGLDGNFYVANEGVAAGSGSIARYNSLGTYLNTFISFPSYQPNGLAQDPATGDWYIGTRNSPNTVLKYSSAGTLLGTVTTMGTSTVGGGLAVYNNELYVATTNSPQTVQVYALPVTSFPATPVRTLATGGSTYVGVAFGPDNNLYMADYGNGRVTVFNPSTGALIRTLTDASIPNPHGVGFTPCTAVSCALTAATKTLETCNNNGTTGTGADDYITFSLNPTGTGLGASYSVTASGGATVTLAAGGAATGVPYGTATAFRLQNGSANGTSFTITVTDVSGAPCVVTITVQQSGCSTPPCALTAATQTLETCNNNGTTGTGADDYITFSLNPTGTGLGASYSVTANNGGTVTLAAGGAATGIAYGSATAFRLQNGSSNGTLYTITVTDVSGAPCVATTTVQQNTTCSAPPACALTAITFVNPSTCNDNGTNTNATDDYFTADITVTFSNPPTTGNLELTGDILTGGGATSVTVATAGAGPTYTFTGVRLRADGTASAVTATFSADNACTFSITNGPNVPSCSICVVPVLATNNGTVCIGNSVSLVILVTGNSPAGTLTFYTSQADAVAATNVLVNSTVAPIANTTYYVRSEIAVNCFSTASVSITVVSPLPPTVTNGSVCAGGSIDLATLVTSTGGGTLSFYTSQANANAGTNALGSSIVSPTTTTNYYVRSTAAGCYGVKEITVTITPVACGSIIITGPN
jgi:Ig-like domain CHU_C associated